MFFLRALSLACALSLVVGASSPAAVPGGSGYSVSQISTTTAFYPEGPTVVQDRLYFVEYGLDQVSCYQESTSTTSVVWRATDKCGVSGMIEASTSTTSEDHLYITCYESDQVLKLSVSRSLSLPPSPSTTTVLKTLSVPKGPNDLAADGLGGLFVSASGSPFVAGAPAGGCVYHVKEGVKSVAKLLTPTCDLHYANGLVFLLRDDGDDNDNDKKTGEQRLLVSEHLANRITSFGVRFDADGQATLTNRRTFADLSSVQVPSSWSSAEPTAAEGGWPERKLGPDGLAQSPFPPYSVFVAHYGAGAVLELDKSSGTVRSSTTMPARWVTNVAFGKQKKGPGKPGAELFVTALDKAADDYPGRVFRLTTTAESGEKKTATKTSAVAANNANASFEYENPVAKTSPWPQVRRDRRNTAYSPIDTSVSTRASLVDKTAPGRQYWEFPTKKGIFNTAVIGANQEIFLGSADKFIYCLEPDGRLRWKVETAEILDASAVVLADGSVAVPCADGKLRRLNAQTGESIWEFAAHHSEHDKDALKGKRCGFDPTFVGLMGTIGGPSNWFEGHAAVGMDGKIFAGNDAYRLYAVNQDGTEAWAFWPGPAPFGTVWGTIASRLDGSVVFAGMDGGVYSVTTDGDCMWRTQFLGPSTSMPTLDEARGQIYVTSWNGWMYCLAEATGAVLWKFETGDHVYGSTAMDNDGNVYFGSTDGTLYSLDHTGTLRWKFDTLQPIRSSPAVSADGTVFFSASDGKVYAIHSNDGILRWSFDTTACDRPALNSNVVLGLHSVIVGAQDGRVINIPYDYCETLNPTDKRCKTNAEPREKIELYWTTAGGSILPDPTSFVAPRLGTLSLRVAGSAKPKKIVVQGLSIVPAPQRTATAPGMAVFAYPSGSLRVVVVGDMVNIVLPASLDADTPYLLIVVLKNAAPAVIAFRTETAVVSGDAKLVGSELVSKLAPTESGAFRAMRLYRYSPWQPAVLQSLNQIGFDSVDLVASVLYADPKSRAMVLYMAGAFYSDRDGRSEGRVDPAHVSQGLFDATVEADGSSVLLEGKGILMQTGGPVMESEEFTIAARFQPNSLSLTAGGSVYTSSSCFSSFEAIFLCFVGGIGNGKRLYSFGSIDAVEIPANDPLLSRDAFRGIGMKEWQLKNTYATGQLKLSVDLRVPREVDVREHVFAVVLVDTASTKQVPMNYKHALETKQDKFDASAVKVVLTITHSLSGIQENVKAFVMVDLVPVATFDVPAMTHTAVFRLFGGSYSRLFGLSASIVLGFYGLLRFRLRGREQRAWILKFLVAQVMSACALFAIYNLLTSGELLWCCSDAARAEDVFTRFGCVFFPVYAFLDIVIGRIDYGEELTLGSSYTQHLTYSFLCIASLVIREPSALMLMLFTLEIPRGVKSLGFMFPAIRGKWLGTKIHDRLYRYTYLLTRVVIHPILMFWMLSSVNTVWGWSLGPEFRVRAMIHVIAGMAFSANLGKWARGELSSAVYKRPKKENKKKKAE